MSVKVKIGTSGIALENISVDKWGPAYFPNLNLRENVHALEDIRKYRSIIIVDEHNGAVEYTPEELKYETTRKTWERVRETHPLPVTEAYVYDDYKEIKFTEEETCYIIGNAAHEADRALPESFEAKNLLLYSDQDCWVRFNDANRVQHFIPAGVYFTFHRRCTKIYVVRHTANGTLRVWAEG